MSFAAPTRMPTNNAEMAQYGDDRKLMVTFSKEPVHMTAKSELAGKPVYEDRDYITIVSPGGKSDMKRPVKLEDDERGPSDSHRFPHAWAKFQNENHQSQDGLPLEHWAPLGKAHVLAFKGAQIWTVEQLANLPDTVLQNVPVMDARKYRDMAIAFLKQADGGAPMVALQAENAILKQDMEIMRGQIAELAANQKKTPGRKPADQGE